MQVTASKLASSKGSRSAALPCKNAARSSSRSSLALAYALAIPSLCRSTPLKRQPVFCAIRKVGLPEPHAKSSNWLDGDNSNQAMKSLFVGGQPSRLANVFAKRFAADVRIELVDRPFNCGWLSTANLLFKPVSISSFCSADSILPSRPA